MVLIQGTPCLYSILGFVSLSMLILFTKILSLTSEINFLEASLFRGLALTIGSLTHSAFRQPETNKISQCSSGITAINAFFGCFSIIFQIVALYSLPLSFSVVLLATHPILSAFMSYFINEQNFTRLEAIGLLSCFIGIIIIARHDTIIPPLSHNQTANLQN